MDGATSGGVWEAPSAPRAVTVGSTGWAGAATWGPAVATRREAASRPEELLHRLRPADRGDDRWAGSRAPLRAIIARMLIEPGLEQDRCCHTVHQLAPTPRRNAALAQSTVRFDGGKALVDELHFLSSRVGE